MAHEAHDDHGNTPAAWTAVIVVLIAFAIGSVAVMTGNWPLFWIGGAGGVVLGGVLGKVLSVMGYGNDSRSSGQTGGTTDPSSTGVESTRSASTGTPTP